MEAQLQQYFDAAKTFYALPETLPAQPPTPKVTPALYVDIPIEPRTLPNTILHTAAPEIPTERKRVALTFDDGPSKTETPRLLEILKKANIHATFFVLGRNAEAHPDIIRSQALDGHEIENHSWNHPYLTKLSREALLSEIYRTDALLKNLTNRSPLFLRPPYGAINHLVATLTPHPMVLWSMDTQDWKYKDSGYITKYVLGHIQDKDIILLHDIHPTTIDAVEGIVSQLKEQGYDFVTVEELLGKDAPTSLHTIYRHG